MSKLSKDAIKMLRRVKRHILAKPLRFRMSQYIRVKAEDKARSDSGINNWGDKYGPKTRYASCGTACCIAGWVDVLTNGLPDPKNIDEARFRNDRACRNARQILGLSEYEADQLFMASWWPPELYKRYCEGGPTAKARAGAEMIERFIAANR